MKNTENMSTAALNNMQAKISQRMKILNGRELSHMEKLCQAVSQNCSLSHEQMMTEVYEVKRLAALGSVRIQHAAEHGKEDMRRRLSSMNRKECISEMMSMLSKIHEWDKMRKHDALTLPEEIRGNMDEVYRCISNGKEITLTKEEAIDLTLALTEQYCMIRAAEGFKLSCSGMNPEDFERCSPDERRELAVAAAMNLKKTDKLSFDCSEVSDEDYATLVCAMDSVNGYCMAAAAGKMSLLDAFCTAGSILLGSVMLIAGAVLFTVSGGFIDSCLSLVALVLGCKHISSAIRSAYHSLFPAGLSESRVGVAVTNAVRTVTRVAENIVNRAFRIIGVTVGKLVDAVRKGARTAAAVVKNAARAVSETIAQRSVIVS